MADERAGRGLRGRDLVGLGSLLVGAVVGGLVLGMLVDRSAGTSPAFALAGLACGVVAGVLGCWVRIRDALRE